MYLRASACICIDLLSLASLFLDPPPTQKNNTVPGYVPARPMCSSSKYGATMPLRMAYL